jgi:hypothetical protein
MGGRCTPQFGVRRTGPPAVLLAQEDKQPPAVISGSLIFKVFQTMTLLVDETRGCLSWRLKRR